jgi:hypothetical protein
MMTKLTLDRLSLWAQYLNSNLVTVSVNQEQPRGRKRHLHDIMVEVPQEATPFQEEEYDVDEN